MITQNKRLVGIVLAVGLLLLINFIAKAPWSLFDYVAAGILLLGSGLMFEFVMRGVKNTKYRIAIFVALLGAFLLIWIEISVGLFGTLFAGN